MKAKQLKAAGVIMDPLESPTTRGAGGLDFSAIGGKKQRRGSALIGAGLKTPNHQVSITYRI
jgi:hypothetical protein